MPCHDATIVDADVLFAAMPPPILMPPLAMLFHASPAA